MSPSHCNTAVVERIGEEKKKKNQLTQNDNWFPKNKRHSWGFRSTSAGPENYTQSMSAETKYSLDERIKIIPKLGYIGKDSSGLVS